MKLSRLPRFGARTGMTLVEIVAVVVILGLLATTLTVGFSGSFGKAKSELARTGIGQVTQKLELYKIEKDAWPSLDVGLRALSEGFATPSDSFYLEPDQLLDPWGKPYYLVTPGPDQRPYEVVSYGADAQPGGEGESADISSARSRARQ